MAFRGNKAALAIKVQSAVDTPATPNNSTDVLLCYDMQPGGDNFTLANPEYTGTVDRPGDAVMGRQRSVTFNVILRGPGGSSPPSADAFVFGRILRQIGFGEIVQASPMFTAAALVSTTGQNIVLPAAASSSDDVYNGLPLQIANQGTGAKQLSFIRDYTGSSKTALMAETFGTAPSGNVTVPAFLGYRFDAAASDIWLSVDYWLDQKRYRIVNGVTTAFQLNFNVSNNGDTSFTYATVTITGEVAATPESDEAAPALTPGGAMPVFRDADWWIANKSVCGSSMTVDFNIQAERAPCPTRASGGEAMQIVSRTRSATLVLNEVLLATQDYNALADAQAYHSAWLQYGNITGKTVMFGINEARLGYSEANIAGNFVQRSQALFIDQVDKSMSLVFPYY